MEKVKQSEKALSSRFKRVREDLFGGILGGAAAITAFEIADDYINIEPVFDSELAALAAIGATAGGLAVTSTSVVKEGLDTLLNRETKNEEDQGRSLIPDSVKNIGSYMRAGFVTGYLGAPAIVAWYDHFNGETVLDVDLITAHSMGAIGGAALMGSYGLAKESIGTLLNKAKLGEDHGRSLEPYILGGFFMGLAGLPTLVGLDQYIKGETVDIRDLNSVEVLGTMIKGEDLDTSDLGSVALLGAMSGAAIVGTYGTIKEGLGALADKFGSGETYKSDTGTQASEESAIPAPEENYAEPQK